MNCFLNILIFVFRSHSKKQTVGDLSSSHDERRSQDKKARKRTAPPSPSPTPPPQPATSLEEDLYLSDEDQPPVQKTTKRKLSPPSQTIAR